LNFTIFDDTISSFGCFIYFTKYFHLGVLFVLKNIAAALAWAKDNIPHSRNSQSYEVYFSVWTMDHVLFVRGISTGTLLVSVRSHTTLYLA